MTVGFYQGRACRWKGTASVKKSRQHHRGPGGTSLASNAEHLEDNVSFQRCFSQIPDK